MKAVGFYLTKTYFRPIESLKKSHQPKKKMEHIGML